MFNRVEQGASTSKHTGIRKLPNGRYRARYFAGYNQEGKRIYPARTFDTESEARKWRAESVTSRISTKDLTRTIAQQYSQGAVYTAPFAIPSVLKPVRRELLEIHLPLAHICCVYFLVSLFDEVLYVGQTIDLHQRIKAHQRAEVRFSRVLFVPVQEPDLNTTEAYFIRTLNPPLNRSRGRNGSLEPAEMVRDLVARR